MKRILFATVLVLMLALAAGVAAQDEPVDVSAPPNFAAIFLAAGFPLDPYLVRVESSGTVDASTVQEGCVGVIPDVPDVLVNWTGTADQLSFFVYSDVDPTLLVVTPSGEILCNDDYNLDTLNPVVTIASPEEGPYAVFVGSFGPEQRAYGWLGVTQLTAEGLDLARADLSPMLALRPRPVVQAELRRSLDELLSSVRPVFGEALLDAGFGAHEAAVTGAGTEPALSFALDEASCSGFINLIPSYRFTLAADAPALAVLFNGESDSTLIVRRPDGTFICNSNAAEGNLNPAVLLENVLAGDYTVWVGTVNPNAVALGNLVISEDAAAQPDVLPAGQ